MRDRVAAPKQLTVAPGLLTDLEAAAILRLDADGAAPTVVRERLRNLRRAGRLRAIQLSPRRLRFRRRDVLRLAGLEGDAT